MECTGRLATNYTQHTLGGQMNYHFICVLPVTQFDIAIEVCLIILKYNIVEIIQLSIHYGFASR